MKADEIFALLLLNGYRGTDIAQALGVSSTAVYQVIHGQTKSLRIQQRIADILEKDINKIWPPDAA